MVVVVQSLSRVQLFETPWTVVNQVSLSMGVSRQGYWSGLPFPSPGDLPNLGIGPLSPVPPHWQADSLPLHHADWGGFNLITPMQFTERLCFPYQFNLSSSLLNP